MAVAAVVIALVAISTATITIIGGGLAGCEAAYQLAERGHPVRLIEMKPHRRTPAQTSDKLAELGTAPVAQDRATPEAHRQQLEEQLGVWGPIIEEAGVKAS